MVDEYLSTPYLKAMLISELSKRTGISTHTIRFYERCGFLKGQRKQSVTSNNYNHYDEECVHRLQLVSEAKSVGFTLAEITEIIDAWYGNTLSRREKSQILENKMNALDAKIKELKQMKKLIRECIEEL